MMNSIIFTLIVISLRKKINGRTSNNNNINNDDYRK